MAIGNIESPETVLSVIASSDGYSSLPTWLQSDLSYYNTLYLLHLEATGDSRLKKSLANRMSIAGRAARALQLGYEPYTIPKGFYIADIGLNWFQRHFNTEPVTDLQFHAPIPPEAMVRYQQAKDLNLFSRTVIASPHFDYFTKVRSALRDLRKDPMIVGYMPEDRRLPVGFSYRYSQNQSADGEVSRYQQSEFAPGANVYNGVGFLIARWGEDLLPS